MVARGAGAARPVLLACRQWDPLGLARRLPSLGVGAWRCAPLLPWRAQCPVFVCAALAAGSGGFGPAPGVVSLSFPPPRPACSALRVAGRPVRVSLTLARWYAIPCGLWVPRARSGCPSGSPRVSLSCVCARALAVSAPPPPLGGVARASRVVPALGAGRAVPRGPCPSACPAPVPCSVWRAWGGAVWSRFPPTWLGVVGAAAGRPRGGAFDHCVGRLGSCAPPPPTARPLGGLSGSALWARACGCGGPALSLWGLRAAGWVHGVLILGAGWGGGGACAVSSGCAAGAGPVGRGVALPLSVPLPSLGRQQSGRHWRCAVHGGRGPPYHSGSCSPSLLGTICAASRCAGVGPLVLRGPHVSRRLGRGGGSHSGSPLGRGGPIPPASGGGAGAPAAGGLVGGRGGGVSRRGLPALLPGGGLRYSFPALSVSPARSVPARACGRG